MNPNQHLMLAFEGTAVPGWLEACLAGSPAAGVTLFREQNMESPDQVAELTRAVQAANSGNLPLLVAVDQEGGQLQGLVGSTPFAGNMALGAADDFDLTRRVTEAMGRELTAVGINLNYAPVADVATRPRNPSLGVRSFGEDATTVAGHVAAAVTGYLSAGVLCTLKHFPGKGEAAVDPHYELPRMDLDMERLGSVELKPFVSGLRAGADLVMTGHYGVPALTGSDEIPLSMSEQAIDGFIRGEMGFEGLVITDALDMGALDQGAGQVVDMIASLRGGTDLLLVMPDESLRERARLAVERGTTRGLIPEPAIAASYRRIAAVRRSLAEPDLDPDTVGSHRDLANELAEASITLVRNDDGTLPLRPDPGQSILVLEPGPTNVTPADTMMHYPPTMFSQIRQHHGNVSTSVYPNDPSRSEIADLVSLATDHHLVVVGTVNATAGQAGLVQRLAGTGKPLVTVALREPQDLASYPDATTHVCTYSGHESSMEALASALFGDRPFPGRLPVTIPGICAAGHGL